MRPITRLRYETIKCMCGKKHYGSELLFLGGDRALVLIVDNEVEIQLMSVSKKDVNVQIVYKHKAKSLRAAKVAARRWLIKHGASLNEEVRKKL